MNPHSPSNPLRSPLIPLRSIPSLRSLRPLRSIPSSPLRSSPRPPRSLLLALAALITAPAAAQDLGLKAPPQTRAVAIVGATIHPITGPAIDNGVVLFSDGKLIRVGPGPAPAPADEVELIRADGKHLYPGLIGAVTELGLTEIGAVRAMRDTAETGNITPEIRPATAVNPDSTLLPVARSAGILTAGITPQGGLIPGKLSIIRLDGWTNQDLTVEPDAGLLISWPAMRTYTAAWMSRPEEEQWRDIRRQLAALDETFSIAAAYAAARAADPAAPLDIRWEAMRNVFPASPTQQKPLFIHAQDYDQIRAAVSWARDRNLRAVLIGGREAPLCAPLLKETGTAVIVLGTHAFPRRADGDYDEAFTLPARLEAAGITWCMASGQEAPHERNLPHQAATAVAYGLDHDAAVRSITLSPAKILGIADRLGSLDPGKSATLIITDGDVLDITTRVEMAWIDGRRIDLSNKQTNLADKYREKYRRSGQLKSDSSR